MRNNKDICYELLWSNMSGHIKWLIEICTVSRLVVLSEVTAAAVLTFTWISFSCDLNVPIQIAYTLYFNIFFKFIIRCVCINPAAVFTKIKEVCVWFILFLLFWAIHILVYFTLIGTTFVREMYLWIDQKSWVCGLYSWKMCKILLAKQLIQL